MSLKKSRSLKRYQSRLAYGFVSINHLLWVISKKLYKIVSFREYYNQSVLNHQ
jgi:hypothetical protein